MSYFERSEEFKQILKQRLGEKRYEHCLAVAECAVSLCKKYGADEDKAYAAGLLHDITKDDEKESQLQIIKNNGIILSQAQENNPGLWHAIAAAAYIESNLAVTDSDIINAVRYHTTGRAGMSLLEKIIYTADYISCDRDYPDVEVMRTLAYESLERAALYSLKYTINKLCEIGAVIHTDSVDFYNELIIQSRKGLI